MVEKSLRDCRILVVEDEYYLADEMATELGDAGAVVLGPVGTVEDALRLIEEESSVDAAVLDISLRGEKVFPVADRLAERSIRFVFVTGYDKLAIPNLYRHVVRCEKPVDVSKVTAAIGRQIHSAS
jgi:DNA-binding NtrC family response regulator